MSHFEIVALYIVLNIVLHLVLMMRVGGGRMKTKINLGDGSDAFLIGRIRAQGNYTENMPIALIALLGLAALKAAPIGLHIIGTLFLVGRLLHAHGMAQPDAMGKGRGIGMMFTMLSLLGAAGYLLYLIFIAQ